MVSPTIYTIPTGLVKSSDNMFMSIGVPSNTPGYYRLTLKVGSMNLPLVFYYVGGKIEYSWRELVLDQISANMLAESATTYNYIKNIIDPIVNIEIYISEPSSSTQEFVTRFKVLRVFEPGNQPQTYKRLMIDGDGVIWRAQMSNVPLLLMTGYDGVNNAMLKNGTFPFFGNYNPGVNMIAGNQTSGNYLCSDLIPLEYGEEYTLAFKATIASGDEYAGSTDSYIALFDENMQSVGSIPLLILEDELTGPLSSFQLSENVFVDNISARWGRIMLETTSGDSITISDLHFGKVLMSDTTFDPTFDATFTAIVNTIIPDYAPNPIAALYGINQCSGIGVSVDMSGIEAAIGKQSRISDGQREYAIKETPKSERLVWLKWTNSYGVKQWMPLTGLVNINQESWREIDYNKFDVASGRYMSMQRRHDSVDNLSAAVGFGADFGAIRSLLESDEVEIFNRSFTCSARCIVTCGSLDRVYDPTEPESTTIDIQLIPNNILL